MKPITHYLITVFLSIAVLLGIASLFTPNTSIEKFQFHEWLAFNTNFISSYGDHDAVHRIVYHGLFGFDKKMRQADMLIVGTSHAEAGLSASILSHSLSSQMGRPIKVMNLGLGWSEPFAFHKQALKNNKVHCKIVLLELFDSVSNQLSPIGKPVITEPRLTAYSKVYETWALTAKDWLLDGYLPRISVEGRHFKIDRFLKYPVGFRQWENGDIWDYWLPTQGEVFQKTPRNLVTHPDSVLFNNTGDMAHSQQILAVAALQADGLQLVTTLVPSNITASEFVDPVKALGVPFIPIPFANAELYDHNHVDGFGRAQVTNWFINNWRDAAKAFQFKQLCTTQ